MIDDCNFLIGNNSASSLYYIGETHITVHNCVFKGKISDKSHYIEGILLVKDATKIVVESCNFDHELKDSVICSSLTQILIPSSVIEICHYAFIECKS